MGPSPSSPADGGSRPPTIVFAYGSLLHPESLATTVRDRAVTDCVPATAPGWRRDFGVAFPNDGTQSDKAYLDERGRRPPVVRFANLVQAPAVAANGILVPATSGDLARLVRRERRYALEAIAVESAHGPVRAWAFLGRPEFTRRRDVDTGWCARSYLQRLTHGAAYWDTRSAGFLATFHQTTTFPHPDRTIDLVRQTARDRGSWG